MIEEREKRHARRKPAAHDAEASELTVEGLVKSTRANRLSYTLLQLQRILLMASEQQGAVSEECQRLLEEAESTLLKQKSIERKLYLQNCARAAREKVHTGPVPPPPILVCRAHDSMVMIPAKWQPPSGEKVLGSYMEITGNLQLEIYCRTIPSFVFVCLEFFFVKDNAAIFYSYNL